MRQQLEAFKTKYSEAEAQNLKLKTELKASQENTERIHSKFQNAEDRQKALLEELDSIREEKEQLEAEAEVEHEISVTNNINQKELSDVRHFKLKLEMLLFDDASILMEYLHLCSDPCYCPSAIATRKSGM